MKKYTIWNILALLTILIGGATTLIISEGQIRHWAKETGSAIPVGQWGDVDLDYGEFIVYYESPVQVPTEYLFQVVDQYGDRMRPTPPPENESYRLLLDGWSGKAVGVLKIEEAGTYRLRCSNASVVSDADIPAEDRIVLMKTPRTWAEASQVRKQILVIGASITFAVFLILYIIHGLVLRARSRRDGGQRDVNIDQTMDVAV